MPDIKESTFSVKDITFKVIVQAFEDESKAPAAAEAFGKAFSISDEASMGIIKAAPLVFMTGLTKPEIKFLKPILIELSNLGLSFRIAVIPDKNLPYVIWPFRPRITAEGIKQSIPSINFDMRNFEVECPSCGETITVNSIGKGATGLVSYRPTDRPAAFEEFPSEPPAPEPEPFEEVAEEAAEAAEEVPEEIAQDIMAYDKPDSKQGNGLIVMDDAPVLTDATEKKPVKKSPYRVKQEGLPDEEEESLEPERIESRVLRGEKMGIIDKNIPDIGKVTDAEDVIEEAVEEVVEAVEEVVEAEEEVVEAAEEVEEAEEAEEVVEEVAEEAEEAAEEVAEAAEEPPEEFPEPKLTKQIPRVKPPQNAATPKPAPANSGGQFSVYLNRIISPKQKDKAAQLISELTGISENEAKGLVGRSLIPVLKGVTKEEADQCLADFRKNGFSGKVSSGK